MASRPLLIVDFLGDGHHPSHVCHLLRFGLREKLQDFTFLIPQELYENVVAQLHEVEVAGFDARVRLLEDDPVWSRLILITRNRRLARWIFVEYLNLRERGKSRLLFLFFDSVIYLTAFSPIPRFGTSGVLFRPTFYYRQRGMLPAGLAGKAVFWLKWITARSCSKRPGIERLFVLDPLAEDYAASTWGVNKFKHVPDPMGPEPTGVRPLGSADPVSERPLRLLVAGALAPRKGLHWVTDALTSLPEPARSNVHLVVVGRPEAGCAEYVTGNLKRLEEERIKLTAILSFVSDEDLDRHLATSHVVLTPYMGFTGSSGIVIRAAHFGKPVVATKEGLLGHLVIRHRLGSVVDAARVEVFRDCLSRIVATGVVDGFDPVSARAFADSSDPDEFSRALFGEAGA